jgi:hypothetical protein
MPEGARSRSSSYRVHHRVATAFRKGSVFLAGDAGHVHSPVGGQGMNTGLQDAHNLALLLADVRHGQLDTAALDRYEQERRPVAVILVKVTDRLFGFIARRNRRTALFRRRVSGIGAHLAPRLLSTRFGRRIGGYLGQYRIRYHFAAKDAPTPTWATDPAVGLRLPPVQDNHVPLRTLAWQLHTYGTGSARPDLPAWIEGPHHFPRRPEGPVAGRPTLYDPARRIHRALATSACTGPGAHRSKCIRFLAVLASGRPQVQNFPLGFHPGTDPSGRT